MCSYCICFPSRRPIFAVRPSKVYFSGCQFQNRTYNSSLETHKKFRSRFHLVIYILEQKNYAGVFLIRVFLLKQPNMKNGGDFLRRMDGSSSCCCCSPVRCSYRSASCAYVAGLTSNVKQILVINLSLLNFYLVE